MPYSFNEDHTHSLGVEIELELVDVKRWSFPTQSSRFSIAGPIFTTAIQ